MKTISIRYVLECVAVKEKCTTWSNNWIWISLSQMGFQGALGGKGC